MPFSPSLQKKLAEETHALSYDERVAQGLSEYGAQQFHAAKGTFHSLTQDYPYKSYLWQQLGNSEYRLRAFLLADKAWKEALQLNPMDIQTHVNLGSLCYEQRNYDEALHHWEMALKVDPAHKVTWQRMGDLYKLMNNGLKAHQCHMKYVELSGPKDLESQRIQRRYEQGLGAYKGNVQIGQTSLHRGQVDHARRAFAKALEYYPGDAKTYKTYGMTLYKLNRLEEAAKAYGFAIQLEPEDPGNYINLGVIYEKQNLWVDAAWCYHQGKNKSADAAAKTKLQQRLTQITATGFNERLVEYFMKAQEALQEWNSMEARRRLTRLQDLGALTQAIEREISDELTRLAVFSNPKKQAEQTFLKLGSESLQVGNEDAALHFYGMYLEYFPNGDSAGQLKQAVEQLKQRRLEQEQSATPTVKKAR
ncbi:MAG: tetratricopeptide repeat protein [Vampirovibrionales bacterium]